VGGTPEQKQHWMSRIANEGLLVAYGATEPQAGSDLAQLKTKAVPVLRKTARSKATRSPAASSGSATAAWPTLYTILANAPGGPTWFVIEKDARAFRKNKPEDKHGIRASNTAALFLEDVYVDADRLMGLVEGQGLAQAQAVFGYTRLMVAAFGLGAGWAALKRAIKYSQTRVQGGAPLNEKQGYMDKLIVPNAVRLEAARAYIEWTAARIDAGDPDQQTEGAVAKYLATEAGNKAAEDSDPGAGRLWLHQGVHGREVQARCAHHHDLRRHLRDHGVDDQPRPLAASPQDQGRVLQRLGGAARSGGAPNNSSGAATAALAMRALPTCWSAARIDRLTRNQHILFRLGELIAFAETAAIFCRDAINHPSDAMPFSPETLQAMSRIHARDAALKVAADGLRWAIGAGQSDPNLAGSLNLSGIYAAQAGLLEDMDAVGKKLVEAFPAE
jgi:acyl-CoA dehydrogenase